MPNLFLACKPQQRLMKIFQRKFAPKSLLQPEAPITVPALLVMRGGFGPCALPALAGQCVVMEEPCTALHQVPHPHTAIPTLLPEASGEVQNPPDMSIQRLVTQPGPMTSAFPSLGQ